jgi:hypothetical protein
VICTHNENGTNSIDYPFPGTSTAVDHVLGVPGLSDADKAAILGGNLVELLRIGAA